MDPVTALIVGLAALITALIGVVRLRRETPDLNVARLNAMLDRYVEDSDRLVSELNRERGRALRLEQELEEERERAKSLIAEKQVELDRSLRRIAILEHQKREADEEIATLRRLIKRGLPGGGVA